MNKAVMIGGSKGIGLAVSRVLIDKGLYVFILDIIEPEGDILAKGSYEYGYCNLLDFDEDVFSGFASDIEIDMLMITAGFGRLADFEYFHTAEIKNMMTVNASSMIRILRLFYDRIRAKYPFYCGVIGSISGLISSHSVTVYAASKATVSTRIRKALELINEQNDTSKSSGRARLLRKPFVYAHFDKEVAA